MSVTALLVYQGHNNLRYKITAASSGGSVTIPNVGGTTPDLQTDALAGGLRSIALAGADGIGTIAAGALNQADARDILLADDSGASVGNSKAPRARCIVAPRTQLEASVDVDVDGDANPTITVTLSAVGVAYLDIELIGAIGA